MNDSYKDYPVYIEVDAVKYINKIADNLEDGNYHNECLFLREFAKYLEKNSEDLLPSKIIEFIAEYNWMQ